MSEDDNENLLSTIGISMALSVGTFSTEYKEMRIERRNQYVNMSMYILY